MNSNTFSTLLILTIEIQSKPFCQSDSHKFQTCNQSRRDTKNKIHTRNPKKKKPESRIIKFQSIRFRQFHLQFSNVHSQAIRKNETNKIQNFLFQKS